MILRIKLVYPYRVLRELNKMANALESLRREVAEAKAGQDSAIALIEGLRDRLEAMADSAEDFEELQAQVEELAGDLSNSTDALAAAVTEPAEGEDPAPADPAPLELDEDGVPVGTGGPGSAGPVENGNVNPGPVTE